MQRILNLNPQKEGKDTTDLETPIDIMAYKLYGLTYDEVKIVDSDFWMSEEEYKNYTPLPMNRGVCIINNLTQVK